MNCMCTYSSLCLVVPCCYARAFAAGYIIARVIFCVRNIGKTGLFKEKITHKPKALGAKLWRAVPKLWRPVAKLWRAVAKLWRAVAKLWRAVAKLWRAIAKLWWNRGTD